MVSFAPLIRGGGGRCNPPVISRCGSLLLSVFVDARSSDDVIAF